MVTGKKKLSTSSGKKKKKQTFQTLSLEVGLSDNGKNVEANLNFVEPEGFIKLCNMVLKKPTWQHNVTKTAGQDFLVGLPDFMFL